MQRDRRNPGTVIGQVLSVVVQDTCKAQLAAPAQQEDLAADRPAVGATGVAPDVPPATPQLAELLQLQERLQGVQRGDSVADDMVTDPVQRS